MRLKIKDKRKFERFITLSFIVVALLVFFFVNISNPKFVEGSSETMNSVIVKQGDTVWSIANNIDTDRDVRHVVDDILNLNDLDTSSVYPGDKLYIPSK